MTNPRDDLMALAGRLDTAARILAKKPCEVYRLQQDCEIAAHAIRLAAEARIAEIRSLLVELIGGFPMSEVLRHAAGKSKHFIVCHPDGQRIYAIRSEDVLKAAALAAEQKEAGK